MVSILTRIFGLSHLEMVEDAVQDTFLNALNAWKNKAPENPKAWLTKAAKNRAIDLLRKMDAEEKRIQKIDIESDSLELDNLFLDHEIADSQLRMIFTACHPKLKAKDQIAFALKTIAGFSSKEIASALLLKEETIKKRLSRARIVIKEQNISFEFPSKNELSTRLDRVHEVLYLIFNEGFHSGRKDMLIRKELCGEAMRLCKMILEKELFRSDNGYALFALMCFHSARLDSKVNKNNEIVDLKNQDRDLWYTPLINLGYDAMSKSISGDNLSSYHLESAIAAEHVGAKNFKETKWKNILKYYEQLNHIQPSAFNILNMSMVQLMLGEEKKAYQLLESINVKDLEQRAYLYYGTKAEYYIKMGKLEKASNEIELALSLVKNNAERNYLMKKKNDLFLN